MHKSKFVIWVVLIIALGGLTLSLIVFFKWNAPLGPSLDMAGYVPETRSISTTPTVHPVSTEQNSTSNLLVTATQPAGSANPATPLPSPAATSLPLCNGPKTMTILGIGSDQRGTSYLYGLADSMYAVYIDFTIPKVMIIDFPRDLWVEIPGIADHYGITHGKLNQAYLFGNPGMGYYDGPGAGPGLLARTLDLNFGLKVDHYIALDMQTLARFVDAVGGVDVKVDSPIDLNYGTVTPDPALILSVGTHHLNGETALLLARNRSPSTFQRTKYQIMILSALRQKLLTPEMIPQLPGLVKNFISSVRTDLSPNDINTLICISQAIPKGTIQAAPFPQEMFKANVTYDQYRNVTTYTLEADFNDIRAKVAEFMSGIWPFP
jgi:LCP family protein required for cell wall assembly